MPWLRDAAVLGIPFSPTVRFFAGIYSAGGGNCAAGHTPIATNHYVGQTLLAMRGTDRNVWFTWTGDPDRGYLTRVCYCKPPTGSIPTPVMGVQEKGIFNIYLFIKLINGATYVRQIIAGSRAVELTWMRLD